VPLLPPLQLGLDEELTVIEGPPFVETLAVAVAVQLF
jgi:hypothetical protein